MEGFFDYKSPNYLGGVNVHNTVAIVLGVVSVVGLVKLGAFKK